MAGVRKEEGHEATRRGVSQTPQTPSFPYGRESRGLCQCRAERWEERAAWGAVWGPWFVGG